MAGRIAGITVNIGGNADGLQKALKGVDQQLRIMRSGLNDVNRLLRFNPTSTTLLTQKQQLLKKSIDETRNRLQTLKEAQAKMDAKGVDKNSEDYQRLQREIVATEDKLKGLEKEYAKVASVAGAQLQAIGGKMKELGAKMTELGQSVTKNVTAPIVAMAGIAVKSFQDVDKGMDAVVKKTGATGEALEGMKDSVNNLATSIPIDFETAGNAVGEVATRFGLTGDSLEDLSGKFAKFAKLNNTDVSTSVDAVQKALSAFGLSSDDASGYLDRLNKVGQDTGVKVDKLAQGIVTNSGAFQEMGLNIDQATIFMGQLEKSGANSETVLNGMRRALKNAAKEGKPLNQALAELQDEILNGKGGMDGLTKSYELFGKSGDQIYSAVKNGTIDFKDLGIAVEDVGGNIETTFENTVDPVDKFKMAINQAKVAGADLGNALLTTLTPMIERLQAGLQALGDKFKSLSPAQQEMIVKVGLIVAAIGPLMLIFGKLTSVIGSVVGGIGSLVSSFAALSAGTVTAAPFLAVAAAIAAMGVATYAAYENHKKLIASQHDFTKSQREAIDGLNATVDAYNDVQKAATEKNNAVAAEFEHVRSLKDEYNGLVDANGKIAEADKARAEVILGDLANALGMEKSEIQQLIDKNGQLSGSIEKVIKMKEAQAYLDANYDSYVNALKLEAESNEKLAGAIRAVDSAEKGVANAQAALTTTQNNLNTARENGARNTTQLAQKVRDAELALDAEKAKLSEAQGAVDKYSNASKDASNKIANYQQLQEAVQTGSLKKVGEAMLNYQQNLKTATTATDKELKKQAKSAQEDYKAMKKAYDQGDITKSALDNAKKRADAAQAEADKVAKSASKETAAVQKEFEKGAKKIKSIFPVKAGKMLSGTVNLPVISASFVEKVKGAAKALFPKLSSTISKISFAKAYDNPKLFTNPSVYGGAVFGDRGTSRGGELVYGRENLMKDIAAAAGGGTTINVTVNGAESPEAWADRFVREYQLQTRTV